MSYAHKLQYAGNKPYQNEAHRVADDDDAMTYAEYEQLTEDTTYRRLAELRWLTSELEVDICTDDAVPEDTKDALFDAACLGGSPLKTAVHAYVDAWLAEYRSGEREEPVRHEPADFGGGDSTGVQNL